MVTTHTHEISTKGQGDAHDVTSVVARAVAESDLRTGIVTVFVVGSTAGLTTIEFEPGALHDVNQVFDHSHRATASTSITFGGATTMDRAMCARRCSVHR